ncbi:MAG TPA: aspartate dehydrogenase domain-containing protein [bacterium]
MIRVGLVGCGTIGTGMALAIERRYGSMARLVALHDIDPARTDLLRRRLRTSPPSVSLPVLIRRSQLVLEAASVRAAGEVATRALRAHRDVLIMSVGGLVLSRAWRRAAARGRARVYVPSGALAGLDGIRALAEGGLRSVRLTTTKPPSALAGAPYVRARKLRLSGLRKPRVVFEGTARDVVAGFPKNANIAAALALACGRARARVRVRIVADPSARVNRHELEAVGTAGAVRVTIESRPSRNPNTSVLAVQSAVAALERIFSPVAVGT